MFSPLFDRTPVSRYIDCYSLAKISEFQADADILSAPKFVTLSAWQAGTISRYSAGESSPIKAGRSEAMHTWRLHAKVSTPSGILRRYSVRSERSRQLWTLPSQTVRGSFCVCANILSTPTFCRREYFVNDNILLMRVFCQQQHFVDPNILSTSIIFVNATISVGANILSPPMFCRCQYFVAVYIFYCV